ncbi:hypothetical protein [Bernardetia sp.]|uniref:hypothetical protein n=1 Tax=Bernardetia sp. TaxID=1937974 RepID=UPI0025B811EB|nr:hypothetical protein [Bernardetia sp.]
MKIVKSIIFAIVDLITLIYGVGLFFLGVDEGGAKLAYGACLIALFFLIRLWRKEYRERTTEY